MGQTTGQNFNTWQEQSYQNAQLQRKQIPSTIKPDQNGKNQTFGQQITNANAQNLNIPHQQYDMNMKQSACYPPMQQHQHHMGAPPPPAQQPQQQMSLNGSSQAANGMQMTQSAAASQYGVGNQQQSNPYYDQAQNLHVNQPQQYWQQQQQQQHVINKQSYNDMNSSLNGGGSSTGYPHPHQAVKQGGNQTDSSQQCYNMNSSQYANQSFNQSTFSQASTMASSQDASSKQQCMSLYDHFHQNGLYNRPIVQNLSKLKEHYNQKACTGCQRMIGRYNLQYYFDSGIIMKPTDNQQLINMLTIYCDHNFCGDCLTHAMKEKALNCMKQNQRPTFNDFQCPIEVLNPHGCFQRCGKRIPEKILQHFLDGVLYKTTTQPLNKYHVQINRIEANKNEASANNLASFDPPKPVSEACKKCNVIHNHNQGVFCEKVKDWKRVHKYSESQKHNNEVEIPKNTEVLGNVIVDQDTIKFFKQPDQLRQLGLLGIYAYEDKVDCTQWHRHQQYLHAMDPNLANNGVDAGRHYEPFSREENIKIEWNYKNLVKAVTKKDHSNMSADQVRSLLQWRQKLDNNLECEFMMMDNDPRVDHIYLRQKQQSIWILREIKEASRAIRKIYRESKPGPRHRVLVLVGTQQQFDDLKKSLPASDSNRPCMNQQDDLAISQHLMTTE